jgi:hypothetical protein
VSCLGRDDGIPPDFGRIRRTLSRGMLVADRVFDEVFPREVRRPSSVWWTPVEVAVRAAKLLAPRPGCTILDIGAGVGKFCIVAAASVRAEVRGLEHRPHLVEIARETAAKVGVSASFAAGPSIEEQDASAIDGVYLFNPFAENLCTAADWLDKTVELNEARFRADVRATEQLLGRARVGTRVVIYCGFGGEMPAGYVLVSRESVRGTFELWEKRGSGLPRARRPNQTLPRAWRANRDAVRLDDGSRGSHGSR